ncbi:VOC family protein [Streptacidiphilus neutrinimicus]|uniref:VOC family protein n=1 Tax=Streptacidiphilus neutrinimicus TaxID=105420 RepID=UPI0005A886B7|nr:VOC family protein [Streptacidiphilus neutrinimicus]
MLSTDYTPGTPRWIDLGSPDVKATDAFYTSLLGWEKEDAGPEAGGYGFYRSGGKRIGGVGPVMDPSATPAWTIYFGTDDAEAAVRAVEQAGGKVRVPASDVMGFGRMAQFTDPQGGEFAVWQPQLTKGFDIAGVPVSLSWTELHTADAEAARGFYTSVFGWSLTDNDMGEFTYTVASMGSDESSFGGLMGHFPGETVTMWLPYFEVADCDATVAKVAELGGAVLMGPASLEGVGRMASVRDPHGSLFSVIASAPQAR